MLPVRKILLSLAFLQVANVTSANPCDPPTGWSGEIVGHTPNGPIVVTADNLYFAAYNDVDYIFSFFPDAHRITIPIESLIGVPQFTAATCTYFAEYQDDIFMDGFEP